MSHPSPPHISPLPPTPPSCCPGLSLPALHASINAKEAAADEFLSNVGSGWLTEIWPYQPPPPPPSPPPLSPTFPIVMISPSCHPSVIPPTLSKHGLLLVAPDIICFVPVTVFLVSKLLRVWKRDGKKQEFSRPLNQSCQEFQ